MVETKSTTSKVPAQIAPLIPKQPVPKSKPFPIKVMLKLTISQLKIQDRLINTFVKVLEHKSTEWKLLGMTETIADETNPDYETPIDIDFFFEKEQVIKFELHNFIDAQNDKVLAKFETRLNSLIGCHQLCTTVHLTQGSSTIGELKIAADSKKEANKQLRFQMCWRNLNNGTSKFLGFCQSISPVFLRISQSNFSDDSTNRVVYQSPMFACTRNPIHDEQRFTLMQLCNSNVSQMLKFSAHDVSDDKEINSIKVTVEQLEDQQLIQQGKEGAYFQMLKFKLVDVAGFVDYLKDGWIISAACGIDMTASNGTPASKSSLHHYGPKNQYLKTLEAVGRTFCAFDQDVEVYGFGAARHNPGQTEVSHCFALNNDEECPSINGIQNILEIYRQSTKELIFSGPTLVTPLLTKFYEKLKEAKDIKVYRVLFVLLDGDADDLTDAKSMIIKLSELPCSIIFIGIGPASFIRMPLLNNKNKLRNAQMKTTERDIVQFVTFKEANNTNFKNVFRKIPEQMCAHLERTGYKTEYEIEKNATEAADKVRKIQQAAEAKALREAQEEQRQVDEDVI